MLREEFLASKRKLTEGLPGMKAAMFADWAFWRSRKRRRERRVDKDGAKSIAENRFEVSAWS